MDAVPRGADGRKPGVDGEEPALDAAAKAGQAMEALAVFDAKPWDASLAARWMT